MACINPDGTLTEAAVAMMTVIENHHSLEEVAGVSGIPLYLVRATTRDLINAGLAVERNALFYLTDDGSAGLKKTHSNSLPGHGPGLARDSDK